MRMQQAMTRGSMMLLSRITRSTAYQRMGRSAALISTESNNKTTKTQRTQRIFLLFVLFVPLWLILTAPAQAAEVYYLFDNSGSMYDGYPAPKSGPNAYYYRRPEFQDFLRQLVS